MSYIKFVTQQPTEYTRPDSRGSEGQECKTHSGFYRSVSGNGWRLASLLVAADVVSANLAFKAGYHLFPGAGLELYYIAISLFFTAAMVAAFYHYGLYSRKFCTIRTMETASLVKAITIVALALFVTVLYFEGNNISSDILTVSVALVYISVYAVRMLFDKLAPWLHKRFGGVSRILVYGAGETGRYIVRQMLGSPRLGYAPEGFIDDDISKWGVTIDTGAHGSGLQVLGGGDFLETIAAKYQINEVIVALPSHDTDKVEAILEKCASIGLNYRAVPNLFNMRMFRARLHDLQGMPLLGVRSAEKGRLYFLLKRVTEIAVSMLVLVLLSPVYALCALLIKIEDGGPVLFSHERAGQDGRPFTMYKFRTMRTDADPAAKSPMDAKDPRITSHGRWLRKTSLDELPQFFNVLIGDMSIVGPRPEMLFIVAGYDKLQSERLKAPPGITGLWQLSGERHRPIHENIEYDLYYLENRSLYLDFIIMAETLLFAARGI